MSVKTLKLPAQAYVYVIGPVDGPQKIGFADDPKDRLSLFQTGNHARLSVNYSLPLARVDVRRVEQCAHFLLQERRVRGEWFDVSPEEASDAISKAVKFVRSGWTLPSAVPGETKHTSMRIKPHIRALADRICEIEHRDLTNLVENLILERARTLGMEIPTDS